MIHQTSYDSKDAFYFSMLFDERRLSRPSNQVDNFNGSKYNCLLTDKTGDYFM